MPSIVNQILALKPYPLWQKYHRNSLVQAKRFVGLSQSGRFMIRVEPSPNEPVDWWWVKTQDTPWKSMVNYDQIVQLPYYPHDKRHLHVWRQAGQGIIICKSYAKDIPRPFARIQRIKRGFKASIYEHKEITTKTLEEALNHVNRQARKAGFTPPIPPFPWHLT